MARQKKKSKLMVAIQLEPNRNKACIQSNPCIQIAPQQKHTIRRQVYKSSNPGVNAFYFQSHLLNA